MRRGDSGHARWRGISLTLAHLSSWTLIWRTAAPSPTPPDSGQFAPLVGAFLFLELVMNARPPIYLGPTPNPHADAERWNDEEAEADALHETAAVLAPGIVLKQLQAIKTPADWFNRKLFATGNSAEDLLREAFADSNDDVADRYAEFIIDMTPAAKEKLFVAMAAWFSKSFAWEIYTEWLEDLK